MPDASSAHSEIDQYGMLRAQFVEPSTGSSTTVIAASSGPVQPDSSLSTRTPASWRIGRIAASATVSRWYWPLRSVRARRSPDDSGEQRGALRVERAVEHLEQRLGVHARSMVTTAL